MRRCLLVSMALIISGVLVWQGGCSKEQKGATEARPDKPVVVAAPAAKTEKAAKAEETAKTKKVSESNEPQPKIVFEELVHNFGEIAPGSMHSCEFKFKNAGKGVLKIGRVDSTCGCTVPKLAKEEYVPGESGEIKVEYHAGKSPGETKKTLFVATNDKENAKITLTIAATVVVKVICKPVTMNLSLKEVNAGCPKITLHSIDNQPFAITGFKSTADCISADYNPEVKNTQFVLEPKADVDKLQKNLNGVIEINLTHPECSSATISYTTTPWFNVSPPSIVVFNANPENPVKKQIVVVNNYGDSFEIESVTSQKGILKVLNQEKSDNRWTLDVEIMPPAFKESKPRMFTDMLTINIKGGQKLEVSCRGFYPGVRKQ